MLISPTEHFIKSPCFSTPIWKQAIQNGVFPRIKKKQVGNRNTLWVYVLILISYRDIENYTRVLSTDMKNQQRKEFYLMAKICRDNFFHVVINWVDYSNSRFLYTYRRYVVL